MDRNIVDGVTEFTLRLLSRVKTGVAMILQPDIMRLIGLEASAMNDLSRIWCKMSHTPWRQSSRVYPCCVMPIHLYGSVAWTIMQVDANRVDAFPDMSANNRRPVVIWFCQQRESENKNWTCPLYETIQKRRVTCLPLLALSSGKKFHCWRLMSGMASHHLSYGEVVTVVPEIPECNILLSTQEVSKDGLCRRRWSWPYN